MTNLQKPICVVLNLVNENYKYSKKPLKIKYTRSSKQIKTCSNINKQQKFCDKKVTQTKESKCNIFSFHPRKLLRIT